MKLLVLLAFTSILALGLAQVQSNPLNATQWEQLQWSKFKVLHQKKYRTTDREQKRFSAFLVNLRDIRSHNANAVNDDDVNYYLKINKFSDWTKEELESLTGEIDTDNVIQAPVMSDSELRQSVPDTVDLRTSPCMPPVKFQGACGSCYSFAAVTPIEYQRCLKTGNLTILSEENLVDCSQKYGNAGCNGGLALRAWNYVKDSGIQTSSAYPYQGEETLCEHSSNTVAANVSSWAYATTKRDENAMKIAVALYGPLAVSVDANEWAFYEKGVFSSTTCSKTATNHAVVIVGYGTDSESKKPYWVIRNSWGPDWGLKGYILMERGVNMCGVAKRVAYPTAI